MRQQVADLARAHRADKRAAGQIAHGVCIALLAQIPAGDRQYANPRLIPAPVPPDRPSDPPAMDPKRHSCCRESSQIAKMTQGLERYSLRPRRMQVSDIPVEWGSSGELREWPPAGAASWRFWRCCCFR